MTVKGTTGTHHRIKEGHIPTKRNKTGRYSPIKNKKLDEIYGEEKANDIKKALSEQKLGDKNPSKNDEVKEKISNTVKKQYEDGRSPSPNFKSGERKDLNHKVRSSWEADVARIFIHENMNYQYEPQKFLLKGKEKDTTYTPDFYLPDLNMYIEVKGRPLNLDKYYMFKEQYKQFECLLITKKEFRILISYYYKVLESKFENKPPLCLINKNSDKLSSETTCWNLFLKDIGYLK